MASTFSSVSRGLTKLNKKLGVGGGRANVGPLGFTKMREQGRRGLDEVFGVPQRPGEPGYEEDPSIVAAQAEEARKDELRQRIDAMFGGPEANSQLAGEETDISGALRGQYGDELKRKYGDAERSVRFGAANTGNIGSTGYSDAQSRLSEENQLAGTKIEEAVRRSIQNLRSSREDVRTRATGLVNAGMGEEGVRSATEGLRGAAETARSANREQLFNEFFNNLAYTRVAGNQGNQNAQLAALLGNRGGGSFFPTTPTQGRIT